MLEAIGHIRSYLHYLTQRDSRRGADAEAHLAHARGEAMVGDVRVRWLGTAGFSLSAGGTTILIDPYVTRLSGRCLVQRCSVPADTHAIARWIDAADAILVGHTHFDHALDVAAISRRFGCSAYGSTSLAHLMSLHGLRDQCVVVDAYREHHVGPFSFEFVPSAHSKLVLGLAVPSGGELTCEHLDALTPDAYRCGQVWGIHIRGPGASFYHQGSADLIDDAIRHRGVDWFFCGIAGRRFAPRYMARILRRLEPRVVIPTHYDDFLTPMDTPFEFSPNVNLAGFIDEVSAVSRDFAVRTLPRCDATTKS